MDKNVLWDLSYGMYVVGSKDDRKVGCIEIGRAHV